MINLNTLGNGLKRGMMRFCQNVSKDFTRAEQKFIAQMVYGLSASGSCKLSEIGRSLKEDIALKKTVERLGRNLCVFSKSEALMDNYIAAVRPSIGKPSMLLVDGSDATKSCSPKMEAIGTVYDASTGKYSKGYWTMGVAALTEHNHQPIPVYEKLYPCKKQGGLGFAVETKNALQRLRKHFASTVPRVFDRGFDSGGVMRDLESNKEHFIIRQNQDRVVIWGGRKTHIKDVVKSMDCPHILSLRNKTDKPVNCRLGATQIILPRLDNLKLNLIVCKEFGSDPLVLYTNLDQSMESIAEHVLKGYLMRWRIEEMYAFKKREGMNFEEFRVRSLKSIQNLDLLLTITIGYIGTLCAKANTDRLVWELIDVSKRIQKHSIFLKKTKFLFYAVFDGIVTALAQLKRGIYQYFSTAPPSPQLCFPDLEKMG